MDFPGANSSLVIEDVLLSTKTIQNICFLYELGRVFDFTADFSKINQLNSGISRTKAIFRFLMISTCRLWWPNRSKMFDKNLLAKLALKLIVQENLYRNTLAISSSSMALGICLPQYPHDPSGVLLPTRHPATRYLCRNTSSLSSNKSRDGKASNSDNKVQSSSSPRRSARISSKLGPVWIWYQE